MNDVEATYYETYDLWVAASMQVEGYQLSDIKIGNKSSAVFVFAVSPGFSPAVYEDDYHSGRITLSPPDLRARVRDLSSRVKRKLGANVKV